MLKKIIRGFLTNKFKFRPKYLFKVKSLEKDCNLGLVGCGNFVKYAYIPAINRRDFPFNISCLFSRTQESSKSVGALLKYKTYCTSNYEECLNLDMDGLVIALPFHLHFEYVCRALEKGLDVFCEKPLCDTLDEAYQLKRLIEKNNLIFMVGYNYRYFRNVQYVKDYISKGLIGNVTNVCASFEQNIEEVIRKKISSDKIKNHNYAVVTDMGCHIINILQYFFGEIISIFADIKNKKIPDSFGEDTAACKFHFKNGVVADMQLCSASDRHPFYRSMLFQGVKGELLLDNNISYRKDKFSRWKAMPSKKESTSESIFNELRHFYNCIKTRDKPKTDIDDAIDTLKVVKGAYISSKEKRSINIEDI